MFTCVLEDCQKSFNPGEWECFDGRRHQVASKTYYVASSLKDVEDRIKSRVTKFIGSDREFTDAGGQKHQRPPRIVIFAGGSYSTSDPEDQLYFDKGPGAVGLISAEQWQATYIHPGELQKMKEREVSARAANLVNQENSLLEREKALKEREAELAKAEMAKRGKTA